MSHSGISRRKFLKQAGLGAAALPFFLETLRNSAMAQGVNLFHSLVWVESMSAQWNRFLLQSDPGLLSMLKKNYQSRTFSDFFAWDSSDSVFTERDQILVFEGNYSADRFKNSEKILLEKLLLNAKVVVTVGNDASFGEDNLLQDLLEKNNLRLIRLSGYPVKSHHVAGTLSHLVLYGIPELDSLRRPKMFYGKVVCDYCEYNRDFLEGNFVKYLGEKEGCLYQLGCKGPFTFNNCPTLRWNGTSEWCVSAGAPCAGCSEPSFPEHAGYGLFSNHAEDTSDFWLQQSQNITKSLFALTVVGVGVHSVALKTGDSGYFATSEEEKKKS